MRYLLKNVILRQIFVVIIFFAIYIRRFITDQPYFLIKTVIPYQGSEKYYKLYREIPDFFNDYKSMRITEYLEGEEWREKLVTVRLDKPNAVLLETSRKFYFESDYLMIRDALVSGLCIFGRDNILISTKGHDNPEIEYPIIVQNHFHSAIALSHYPLKSGALFYNLVFCITAIPEKVIKNSVLMVCKAEESVFESAKEIYSTLYNSKLVFSLKRNEYALVDELHTLINPSPGEQHFATSANNISKLIREKFNLTSIVPSKYAMINREKKFFRHISNFDEIVAAARKQYPKCNWTQYEDVYPNFTITMKTWATFKVLFTITGSNLVKSVAMAPGTAICCIFSDRYDWEVVAISEVFGIFLYALPILSIKHFEHTTNNVDISAAMKGISAVLYVVDNKKWSDETLKENGVFKREYYGDPLYAPI